MDSENYGHTPVKDLNGNRHTHSYWFYVISRQCKVWIEWELQNHFPYDVELYIHILTNNYVEENNTDVATLINPFQVEYKGEIIFTLTDPEWIAKITAALLTKK